MTEVVDQESGGSVRVVVGVDTHQDKHVAVAIDRQGVRLGAASRTGDYAWLSGSRTVVTEFGRDSCLWD